jgi:guanosine-3',5'-bis(diphosphate) 3'-pyrophosphohydrolase
MSERTIVTADVALPALMRATLFAAEKHRGQRRKDAGKTPYINHPIMVVNLLANVGRIWDVETLQAGMLHDTIEDTDTTADELEEHFGYEVRNLVLELTDDKELDKQERKRLQVEHAPHMTPRAKCIKIADKIANVTDLLNAPPAHWPEERMRQYVVWSRQVVDGCRGHNPALELHYDEIAQAL